MNISLKDLGEAMAANMHHLPRKPPQIEPLTEGELVDAGIVGGLSIIGDKGYMCPVVTMMTGNSDTKTVWGWSVCFGLPDADPELYFFKSGEEASTARGTELPNCMSYYMAKIKPELIGENADPQMLKEIVAYVLPHISDNGPPPPHPDDAQNAE